MRLRAGVQRHLVAEFKQGTGVKGIFWDPVLRDGLGDISIKSMDLRMLYWEPEINDIQDSANLFSLALVDTERLKSRWPQMKRTGSGIDITVPQYTADKSIDTSKKSVVVDWYYKKETPAGQTILHYCKFCNGVVLYAGRMTRHFMSGDFTTMGNILLCLTRCLWRRTALPVLATSM